MGFKFNFKFNFFKIYIYIRAHIVRFKIQEIFKYTC